MNYELKKNIQKAFAAPEPNPKEKARFLRTLPQPPISMLRFVLIQAAYLRKRSALLIFALLCLGLMLAGTDGTWLDTLWIVSAFVPFIGLLAVAESNRSMQYGMSELEMSTRFSLKSVVLARMSVLGLLDALIFCCLIPFCSAGSQASYLQTGVYFIVPYLLTVNCSLWMVRHFRSREVIYACMSVAVLVSGANTGLRLMAEFVYQFSYIKWWFILAAVLVGAMMHEVCCTIKLTEEV